MKRCPFCAELIKDEAVLCRFCGCMLESEEKEKAEDESAAETSVPQVEQKKYASWYVKVVIADDHGFIRIMLKRMLESLGCVVVGDAGDGIRAVELYREHRPDLLLLDLNMPKRNGLDALSMIIKDFPGARIVMLTSIADADVISNCIRIGATNYILKDNPREEVQKKIEKTIQEIVKKKMEAGAL